MIHTKPMSIASTPTSTLWQDIQTHGVGYVVDKLTTQESIYNAEHFGTKNYKPLPVDVVRAEGSRVWDSEGREFIDCIGAYSAVAHGHLSPAVKRAVIEQLDRVTLSAAPSTAPKSACSSAPSPNTPNSISSAP